MGGRVDEGGSLEIEGKLTRKKAKNTLFYRLFLAFATPQKTAFDTR
jgi:hypothetical protein